MNVQARSPRLSSHFDTGGLVFTVKSVLIGFRSNRLGLHGTGTGQSFLEAA